MPVFGIGWGAALLGEPITAGMPGGVALVVGGTAAVVRPAPVAPARSPQAAA
jgi:drug/metabolite transporter (DMT)-like permease